MRSKTALTGKAFLHTLPLLIFTNFNGAPVNNNVTRIAGAASVNVWLPHHVGYVPPTENIDVVNVITGSSDAEQGMAVRFPERYKLQFRTCELSGRIPRSIGRRGG